MPSVHQENQVFKGTINYPVSGFGTGKCVVSDATGNLSYSSDLVFNTIAVTGKTSGIGAIENWASAYTDPDRGVWDYSSGALYMGVRRVSDDQYASYVKFQQGTGILFSTAGYASTGELVDFQMPMKLTTASGTAVSWLGVDSNRNVVAVTPVTGGGGSAITGTNGQAVKVSSNAGVASTGRFICDTYAELATALAANIAMKEIILGSGLHLSSAGASITVLGQNYVRGSELYFDSTSASMPLVAGTGAPSVSFFASVIFTAQASSPFGSGTAPTIRLRSVFASTTNYTIVLPSGPVAYESKNDVTLTLTNGVQSYWDNTYRGSSYMQFGRRFNSYNTVGVSFPSAFAWSDDGTLDPAVMARVPEPRSLTQVTFEAYVNASAFTLALRKKAVTTNTISYVAIGTIGVGVTTASFDLSTTPISLNAGDRIDFYVSAVATGANLNGVAIVAVLK
jgi:hypothetical protein